uniref:RNA polymerase n=1 Tax=uncultured Alphaproteobacteria bacterium TaxID=91750 RepID=A0A1B0Z1L9_9PROT|nr:RNA polymerase [uncultured Alphaproteobacteria bacterium]
MQKLFEIGSKVKSVARGYEKVEAEKKLEQDMVRRGVYRFHKNINKSKAKKQEKRGKDGKLVLKDKEPTESTTIYGQHLLQEAIEPVSIEIEKYFKDAFNGHSKKYAKSAELLCKCIPIKELENPSHNKWDAISLIALKAVLDSITIGCTQTKATIKIGNSLEDESRLLFFKESDSKTYSKTKHYLKTRNDYRYKKKVYSYAMNKAELEWGDWLKADKVQLGFTLLDLVIRGTGLVKLQRRVEGSERTPIYVECTQKTMDWIEKKKLHSEALKPMRTPMIIKPKEWSNPFDGGYLTHSFPKDIPQNWRNVELESEEIE